MDVLNSAAAVELFDDSKKLLARLPIAASGFQPGSGGFVARLVRSIAIASGDAMTFRLIASDGATLEEGSLGLADRRISEGEVL